MLISILCVTGPGMDIGNRHGRAKKKFGRAKWLVSAQ
jgi:hypothetical protein